MGDGRHGCPGHGEAQQAAKALVGPQGRTMTTALLTPVEGGEVDSHGAL
jgi:hypothetical protein